MIMIRKTVFQEYYTCDAHTQGTPPLAQESDRGISYDFDPVKKQFLVQIPLRAVCSRRSWKFDLYILVPWKYFHVQRPFTTVWNVKSDCARFKGMRENTHCTVMKTINCAYVSFLTWSICLNPVSRTLFSNSSWECSLRPKIFILLVRFCHHCSALCCCIIIVHYVRYYHGSHENMLCVHLRLMWITIQHFLQKIVVWEHVRISLNFCRTRLMKLWHASGTPSSIPPLARQCRFTPRSTCGSRHSTEV